MQAASGAGELLSFHIAGTDLPEYYRAFHLDRYEDQKYLKEFEQFDTGSGQI